MKSTYAVLGAGMQGTAAAYDLSKFGGDCSILLADLSGKAAKDSAARVNALTGSSRCSGVQLNAMDSDQLCQFLEDVDVALSCVPYWMHPKIAACAVKTKTHMADLGGNTDITHQTLALDDKAKAAGVTLVPDTGLAPGLVNSLGMYLIEQMDEPDTIRMYCGVLPQNPKPPFNYKLTFNVEGLVTEYDYQAVLLREHEIKMVDTLDELEELHIPELGKMEAFTTSGGTSTAPYTFKGKVRNYEYKTIRYPGHCALMRIFKDFGFWREDEIEVCGKPVIPREVFYKVFGESLGKFADRDLCVVRAVGIGKKDGKEKRLQIDILDREDEATGFTSMERLTGFSISIFAIAMANGEIESGCRRYEEAMSGTAFVDRIQQRGIKLTFTEA